MNEPNDKPLHDWVRAQLHGYRPDYDPRDWAAMQRLLRRRRWWRRGGAAAGLGLLMLFVAARLLLPETESVSTAPAVRRSASPSTPAPVRQMTERASVASANGKPALPGKQTFQRTLPSGVVEQNRLRLANIVPVLPLSSTLTIATNLTEVIRQPAVVAYSAEEPAIRQQMLTGDFGPDSTSYRTLTRNVNQWPDAVVVCDLTTSMYPYSTQLFTWLRQHSRNPSVRGFVFFTDCDSLGRQTQPGGPAGRMFVTHERRADAVLPIMLEAARNTVHNNDDAENTVEALLFAQNTFPEAKHLILLADNLSTVKDMTLLPDVQRPVHVVLCGTTGGNLSDPFQPNYYSIAARTKGSLHTIDDDLNPNHISKRTVLHVGNSYYRYQVRRKRFKRTSFDHRPICLLGFIWL